MNHQTYTQTIQHTVFPVAPQSVPTWTGNVAALFWDD